MTAGASSFRLMAWSSSHFGGNLSASFSSNTLECRWYSSGICSARAMETPFFLAHALGQGISTFPFSQSTLVSQIGCFRGSVWIPSCSVVQWLMKLSIALLSSRAFSTVDRSAHTVKGMFIFCMLWYRQFGSFTLPQVVEVEQFKNPPVRRKLCLGLYPGRR